MIKVIFLNFICLVRVVDGSCRDGETRCIASLR